MGTLTIVIAAASRRKRSVSSAATTSPASGLLRLLLLLPPATSAARSALLLLFGDFLLLLRFLCRHLLRLRGIWQLHGVRRRIRRSGFIGRPPLARRSSVLPIIANGRIQIHLFIVLTLVFNPQSQSRSGATVSCRSSCNAPDVRTGSSLDQCGYLSDRTSGRTPYNT